MPLATLANGPRRSLKRPLEASGRKARDNVDRGRASLFSAKSGQSPGNSIGEEPTKARASPSGDLERRRDSRRIPARAAPENCESRDGREPHLNEIALPFLQRASSVWLYSGLQD